MNLKKVFSSLVLKESAPIPFGYGVAYWDRARAELICYPVPINLLVNLKRKIEQRIIGPSLSYWDKQLRKAYFEGSSRAYQYYASIHEVDKEKERKRGFNEGYLARQKELEEFSEQYLKERSK